MHSFIHMPSAGLSVRRLPCCDRFVNHCQRFPKPSLGADAMRGPAQDMDVMFMKDFEPAGIPHTPVVAVGAEARRAGSEAQSKENPGVLYINVEVGRNRA